MRIYVMLASQPGNDPDRPVLRETFEKLRRRGFEVDIGYSADLLTPITALAPAYDLYLLKSRSPFWLNLAGVLHQQNARVLNPYPGCQLLLNKALMTARLQAHHLPTPRSWVTGDVTSLYSIAENTPLILKPYDGYSGAGIQMVRHPNDLKALTAAGDQMLAQEYVAGGETYFKVYVIGEQVFGLWKKFPADKTAEKSGVPGEVTAEIRSIALQCGRIFDLSLYNVDIVYAPDGPKVVDVNFFPSYQGVPGAASLLAEHIEAYARRCCSP